MKSLILLLSLFVLGTSAGPLGRVLRITTTSKADLDFLRSLESQGDLDLDFWTHPSHVGATVDVRVSDGTYPRLAKMLQAKGIVFTIQIPDVDALSSRQNPIGRSSGFRYDKYNRLAEIEGEMERLVRTYSHIATMENSFGNTYEGRQMKAIKISSAPGQGRKIFFINCGIHAREWITPATCMNMINFMLSKYGKDNSVTTMIDKMDYVIMPVLNADGYAFTWTRDNRMWRKTRSRYNGNSCIGADPNRNFNFKWGGIGTSSYPCSDLYHGKHPFSEIEVLNVARYLYRHRRSLVAYMDIHAYSQLWMTPWGYTKHHHPRYDIQKNASDAAVSALSNAGYGTSYKVGPASIIIYAVSGSSMDWTLGVLGVTHSYALELRQRPLWVPTSGLSDNADRH